VRETLVEEDEGNVACGLLREQVVALVEAAQRLQRLGREEKREECPAGRARGRRRKKAWYRWGTTLSSSPIAYVTRVSLASWNRAPEGSCIRASTASSENAQKAIPRRVPGFPLPMLRAMNWRGALLLAPTAVSCIIFSSWFGAAHLAW